MIQLNHFTLRRGARILIRDAQITVPARARVGLVGANGCGKSTLLAALRGEAEADAGDIYLPIGTRISSVEQEMPAVDTPALDYTLAGDRPLSLLQARLQEAVADDDGAQIARLHAELETAGAYTASARAAKILAGLGFANSVQTQPVRNFSGGWRMRLNLARTLMCPSDLLLLDEPTNHLDLDAIIWLEDWLRRYEGTLLVVSHDRDFLDGIANRILHIENQTLTLYTGNYSEFERLRAEKLAMQQALHERQTREIEHVKRFVARFGAKASKARQAQSRLKALARMEVIAQAHVDAPFQFEFPAPPALPHPLLRLEQAALGYSETAVLRNVTLSIGPGDRVGLLGPNGAGKSTLIKTLAGQLPPVGGTLWHAPATRIGYFAQHQLEQLRGDRSPLQHFTAIDKTATEQSLRDFLGGFGFGGDNASAPVAPLSGGEKARLVLALIVYQKPNVLLLDEPTNHLDLDMRQALTMALQDFSGAVVLVSHDRHLLRCVSDDLLLVIDGRVAPFAGDVDDYGRWLLARQSETPTENLRSGETAGPSRKDQRRREAEIRQRLQPLKSRVTTLEKQLSTLQTRLAAIEQDLANASLYEASQREALKTKLAERTQAQQQLAQVESDWLIAAEELESAERNAAAEAQTP